MAFNLNRQPNEEQNNTSCDCENTDKLNPEVVATRGWVFQKLGEFKALVMNLEKNIVTKLLRTDDMRSNEIVTDHIMSKKYILIDDEGNKMEIKVQDGNLVAEPIEDSADTEDTESPTICDCVHHCNSPIISDNMLNPNLFDDEPPTICTCCKH